MANFSFMMIGQDDQSLTSAQLLSGSATMTVSSAAQMVTVTDNAGDVRLDDDSSSSPQVLDLNQQFLTTAYDGITGSRLIQSFGKYTAVNTTSGVTGTAYLIRFLTTTNPTDPTEPGTQFGQWYIAFSFDTDPGNVITLGARDAVGAVNYSGLYVCFTHGTMLRTPFGEICVENLSVGDLVTTLDHGPQPIRWIGSRSVMAFANATPVVIKAGALGNSRDLSVSQQHRMLITDWRAELMFGEPQVLVPAKSLVNHDTIFLQKGGEVEYFHILFDQHELVWAEGILSESFHPGTIGLASLELETQDEVRALFPELAQASRPLARPALKNAEAALLA
jgi:hypothetical protein